MNPEQERPIAAHFLWLRIGLALSVVFVHFAAISGNEGHGPHLLSSMFAVQAFFVISGWIVPASFDRSATTLGFFMRRFARLYPLYAAVVFAQALLGLALGPALDKPASELFRYLTVNLLFLNFLQPSLFGLFAATPVAAINPSLWTLKIESLFYLIAPLLVLAYRLRKTRALVCLSLGSIALFYLALSRSENLARQLPGQLRFFVAGLVCWRLSAARVGVSSRWLAPLALVALVLAHRFENVQWLGFAQPVLVAGFVYAAALTLPEPRRMPDISYGLYILHAPLIHVGLGFGWFLADGTGLACAIALVAMLASLTWYGLEKPAIAVARRWSARVDSRSKTAAPVPSVTEARL